MRDPSNSHHRLPPFLPPPRTRRLSKSPPAFCLPGPSLSSFSAHSAAVQSGLKSWSSGAKKKSLKEEAIESLKAIAPTPAKSKGPSPVQTLLGGLSAGVIALVLYKFTITIEDALNRQTLSDNFSVRQITITIRTIVDGLCYLATFVFGINSVGLFLYSAQLAINSFMGNSSKETESQDEVQLSSTAKNPTESFERGSKGGDQNSDGMQ